MKLNKLNKKFEAKNEKNKLNKSPKHEEIMYIDPSKDPTAKRIFKEKMMERIVPGLKHLAIIVAESLIFCGIVKLIEKIKEKE